MAFIKMPYVVEQTPQGARQVDLYSRLLWARIVLLTGAINDDVADSIVSQLFFLESDDPGKDIFFYLNSPGGAVTAGLAIYDTMQYVSCDIATICLVKPLPWQPCFWPAARKGRGWSSRTRG